VAAVCDKPPSSPTTEIVVMQPDQLSALVQRAVRDEMERQQGGSLLCDKQTLARQLNCSGAHIDNLRKRGLPVVHVGDALRFDPKAVLLWLREQGAR